MIEQLNKTKHICHDHDDDDDDGDDDDDDDDDDALGRDIEMTWVRFGFKYQASFQ